MSVVPREGVVRGWQGVGTKLVLTTSTFGAYKNMWSRPLISRHHFKVEKFFFVKPNHSTDPVIFFKAINLAAQVD